jgi:hypothetical protein
VTTQGYRLEECERAVWRGAKFLYRFTRSPRNFAQYGSDLLGCFQLISIAAASAPLRRWGREAGVVFARRWRRLYSSVPPKADADEVFDLIYGSYHADLLGVRDRALKSQLRGAARRFSTQDYLSFDPVSEPPPLDVPHVCRCGFWNERGRKTCRQCRRRVEMMSRYLVWYGALIRTYIAARAGVSLGAEYADVLRWLPSLRPYPSVNYSGLDFYEAVYAVTHIVYTLNDYDVYSLRPRWLPHEFKFLKASLKEALAEGDEEMVGELLECLKCFGLTGRSPLIRAGTDFLLSRQNADGSWGETDAEDIYLNYHPTLTAAAGLLEIRWRSEGLTFPELKPLLARLAKDERGTNVSTRARRSQSATATTKGRPRKTLA